MLSAHFSLSELTKSATAKRLGLDNTPNLAQLANLQRLAQALEVVRMALGNKPLHISIAFRSPKVNKAVGGAKHSYHLDGLAADFDPPEGWTHDAAQKAIAAIPDFDFDLVLEERARDGAHWLHFQIPREPGKGRRRVLDAELAKQGGTITRITNG